MAARAPLPRFLYVFGLQEAGVEPRVSTKTYSGESVAVFPLAKSHNFRTLNLDFTGPPLPTHGCSRGGGGRAGPPTGGEEGPGGAIFEVVRQLPRLDPRELTKQIDTLATTP